MKLKELLTDAFAMKDDEYVDGKGLTELEGFDSMNHMLFITRLEEEFSVELTGDEIADMQTVGHIKSVLSSKGISDV